MADTCTGGRHVSALTLEANIKGYRSYQAVVIISSLASFNILRTLQSFTLCQQLDEASKTEDQR